MNARLLVATITEPWKAGLARQGAVGSRRRMPEASEPITLDYRLDVAGALQILASQRQGIAFVSIPRGRSGVVTAKDLRFAREWAGPYATVGQAVTQAVIDLEPDQLATDLGRFVARREYATHGNVPNHSAQTEEP